MLELNPSSISCKELGAHEQFHGGFLGRQWFFSFLFFSERGMAVFSFKSFNNFSEHL
jgi:hypothetical protein